MLKRAVILAMLAMMFPAVATARVDTPSSMAKPAPAPWTFTSIPGDARTGSSLRTPNVTIRHLPVSLGPRRGFATLETPPTSSVNRPSLTLDYGLFGSVALPIGRLPATAEWERVSAGLQAGFALCASSGCANGTAGQLAELAARAKLLPGVAALVLVNRTVNNVIAYRSDTTDIWSSPAETAARGAGDCEDFAIAKFGVLRAMGFDETQLQLIVLKDVRRGLYHAVLAVHIDGKRYILDNLSDRVLADTALPNYQPVFSFAGGKSFIHGFAGRRTDTAGMTGGLSAVRPGEGL